ncbi:MAG: hypothetical protein JSS34_04645 [Proteobacteria bacterium]|nr:hypothetical protein [Pseudomonadota bacterium]
MMNNQFSYDEDFNFSKKIDIEDFKKDEKGYYLLLNQTPFYPQGGGQPSDQGWLITEKREIPIISVRIGENEIRHYTDQYYDDVIGEKAICKIDLEKRDFHSKLHTAGHFISNIIEEIYPAFKALKGHHFPGECYVEFSCKNEFNLEIIDLNLITQKITQLISDDKPVRTMHIKSSQLSEICPDLPFKIPESSSVRLVSIGEYPYQPCGGTHVKGTSCLKGLSITKMKIKNMTLKVYYTID